MTPGKDSLSSVLRKKLSSLEYSVHVPFEILKNMSTLSYSLSVTKFWLKPELGTHINRCGFFVVY